MRNEFLNFFWIGRGLKKYNQTHSRQLSGHYESHRTSLLGETNSFPAPQSLREGEMEREGGRERGGDGEKENEREWAGFQSKVRRCGQQ